MHKWMSEEMKELKSKQIRSIDQSPNSYTISINFENEIAEF